MREGRGRRELGADHTPAVTFSVGLCMLLVRESAALRLLTSQLGAGEFVRPVTILLANLLGFGPPKVREACGSRELRGGWRTGWRTCSFSACSRAQSVSRERLRSSLSRSSSARCSKSPVRERSLSSRRLELASWALRLSAILFRLAPHLTRGDVGRCEMVIEKMWGDVGRSHSGCPPPAPLIRVVQLAIKRLLVGKLLPRRLEVAGARSLLLIEGHQLSLVITVRLGILIDSRSCGRG